MTFILIAIEKIPTKMRKGCWKDAGKMMKGWGKVQGRLGKGWVLGLYRPKISLQFFV
jgi:hypothetical protein